MGGALNGLLVGLMVAMVALSGCTDSPSTTNTQSAPGRNPQPYFVDVTLVSGSDVRVLDEDEYLYFDFDVTESTGGTLEAKVSVRDGDRIDVVLLVQGYLEAYIAGDEYRYYDACSDFSILTTDLSCDLNKGEYTLVIENTNAGQAKPATNGVNDYVQVDYSVFAKQTEERCCR